MDNNEFGFTLLTFILSILLVVGLIVFQVKVIVILVEWLTQGTLILTFKQGFALKVLSDALFNTRLIDFKDTKKE